MKNIANLVKCFSFELVTLRETIKSVRVHQTSRRDWRLPSASPATAAKAMPSARPAFWPFDELTASELEESRRRTTICRRPNVVKEPDLYPDVEDFSPLHLHFVC